MSSQRFEVPMRAAILEARKGRFDTTPNPTVGAVLLHDGRVVARGHHARAGGPHAEIACLEDARRNCVPTRGMTMVVTLEPCNHQGRTGPCSEALIRAGISRVVIGASDPNPRASGGAARLREAGVDVIEGVLEPECRMLVADYLTWLDQKRPFVILKLASTLDGRIATRAGQSRWITGEAIRREVHRLRNGIGRAGGAIMVGGKTFRRDDPELTARGEFAGGRQPRAFVFTAHLPEADAPFHLLRERPEDTTFLVPQSEAASDRAKTLADRGCGILTSQCDPDAPVADHLRSLMGQLNPEKVPYILCEGGGRLGLMLIESGLCDLFYLHMATKILGDNQARALFDGRSPETLDGTLPLRHVGIRSVGADLAMAYLPGSAWYAPTVGEIANINGDATLWACGDDDAGD